MGNSKNSTKKPNGDREVEVLYQKLGGKWFAFSLIDDEVFFGKVDSTQGKTSDDEEFLDLKSTLRGVKKLPDLDQ